MASLTPQVGTFKAGEGEVGLLRAHCPGDSDGRGSGDGRIRWGFFDKYHGKIWEEYKII